ncbi:MAG TPA: hypothetical protein VGG74_04305 [Kofleriaceae bacterium]
MRSALLVSTVLTLASTTARAQPGPDSPPPPPPYGPSAPGPYAPPPGPPGAYAVPPPYAYQPPTPDEAEMMRAGYIDPMRAGIGGVVAIFVGFGLGQAVEGRWHDTGWIFSLTETASIIAMVGGAIGVANCNLGPDGGSCASGDSASVGFLIGGALAFTGFHIWEIVDAFAGPAGYNEQVHELRRRYGYRDYARNITPYLARPQSADGGMTAGLSLRF